MQFFDTHCDTAMRVLDGELDFAAGKGGHIGLPQLIEAGSCAQVFACFVLSERHPGKEKERAKAMIEKIYSMAGESDGALRVVKTSSELQASCDGGEDIAAIIGLEGADPLEGRAENLRDFYDLGVRDIIPAWQDNPFSGTAFGRNTPLTDEGKKLIELAEELRTMVDVSHLSDNAFADVCKIAKRPFIASHSNCRALCPTLRNLTDDMIRKLSDHGGVMGINLSPSFLDPVYYAQAFPRWQRSLQLGTSQEEKKRLRAEVDILARPPIDWITRHVLHAIEIGGEDVIGLGGDLDGISKAPQGIETIADYVKIPDLLLAAGLRTAQVEKVCYANFERVFREVLTD
ncbi:membrane dipeptidase [Candidatus Bipolaricaulota bacterium]|nr:membrane dipeptidase [Candidatus Bipolaricaulota bacterium]